MRGLKKILRDWREKNSALGVASLGRIRWSGRLTVWRSGPCAEGLRLLGGPKRELTRQEGEPRVNIMHLTIMEKSTVEIFDEKYRVVAVESQCLVIRGVRSGRVLTIMNPDPETPLTLADYPPGKLIALSDPSAAPLN